MTDRRATARLILNHVNRMLLAWLLDDCPPTEQRRYQVDTPRSEDRAPLRITLTRKSHDPHTPELHVRCDLNPGTSFHDLSEAMGLIDRGEL